MMFERPLESSRPSGTINRALGPKSSLVFAGEHGGDLESVHSFNDIDLGYVSCSPFRVPVAPEAGRGSAKNPGRVGERLRWFWPSNGLTRATTYELAVIEPENAHGHAYYARQYSRCSASSISMSRLCLATRLPRAGGTVFIWDVADNWAGPIS